MITLRPAEIRKQLGPRVSASFAANLYVLPEEKWLLKDFLPWWRSHLNSTGMMYRKDIYDCDDFSRAFVNSLVLSARAINASAAVAVAMLRVNNVVHSLSVPPGSHCLNLIGVNHQKKAAWIIVEPQNNLHVHLENYSTADGLRAHF